VAPIWTTQAKRITAGEPGRQPRPADTDPQKFTTLPYDNSSQRDLWSRHVAPLQQINPVTNERYNTSDVKSTPEVGKDLIQCSTPQMGVSNITFGPSYAPYVNEWLQSMHGRTSQPNIYQSHPIYNNSPSPDYKANHLHGFHHNLRCGLMVHHNHNKWLFKL